MSQRCRNSSSSAALPPTGADPSCLLSDARGLRHIQTAFRAQPHAHYLANPTPDSRARALCCWRPQIVGKSVIRRSTVPSGCELPRICIEYDPQRNRLFSRREAQGAPSEVVEVGDLSRRENKLDRALVGLFSDHDDGQQGRQGSPQAVVGQAPLPTPAMAPGVMDHQPSAT
jgi:hypothetical protein